MALLVGSFLASAASGCHIDIVRVRAGRPLPLQVYEDLAVQKTTRGEVLEKLGAPEKAEWKSKDYFYYLYRDSTLAGVRFQFPPFRSAFGYQHTFLTLQEGGEDLNAIQLVFDEAGVLEEKSLRLSSQQEEVAKTKPNTISAFHLTPHFEHSVLLLGDGGFRDYDRLFENGFRAGLAFDYQPYPIVALFLDTAYQEHQGSNLSARGMRFGVDDLELFTANVGVRLEAPISLLWNLSDVETVQRLFVDDNVQATQGLRFFLSGSTGIVVNGNVPLKVDGVRSGNLYDNGLGFAGEAGAGLLYAWPWGQVYVNAIYQILDPFDRGNSPVDDKGSAFQTVLVGGGVAIKL